MHEEWDTTMDLLPIGSYCLTIDKTPTSTELDGRCTPCPHLDREITIDLRTSSLLGGIPCIKKIALGHLHILFELGGRRPT